MKKEIYQPKDLAGFDYERDLGDPGEYPYTRGIHSKMYRKQLWTMRQFSGFGSAEDTNRRFKYLLSQGETGLSVAFDMPTLLGLDSDHPKARGDIGRGGVAIDSLKDMEILFKGIDLGNEKLTTSMTINAPAAVLLAMYIAVAEKQGVDQEKLGGTIQNDMLKEYIAQKEWIFPPTPAMRLIVDIIEYCSKYMPRWNTISISGYHIGEAGATPVQELAFTLADGMTYVEAALKRGLDIDCFAPRLSFFFDIHNNFLEEIAKLRAARRMWAKIMKEKFGAKDQRSLLLRVHAQTAGYTLSREQPLNNIARVALQAMAACLGGVQSLHTNSYDEQLCLPTEEAVTVALRTQQIIAYETGITKFVDPLAGSYTIEALTNEIEEKAWEYIREIDARGGMMKALEEGFPQGIIRQSAFEHQAQVERKEKIIVGVNEFVQKKASQIAEFEINTKAVQRQLKRLENLKLKRNNDRVLENLKALGGAAQTQENLMPYILKAVKAYATLGEICQTLKNVFGEYREVPKL